MVITTATVPAVFESSRVSAASVGQLFVNPSCLTYQPVAEGKQSKSGKNLLHQGSSPLPLVIRSVGAVE